MSIFYTMDVQDTIYGCKGSTLEEAKNKATEEAERLNNLGNYATIDDFGVEVRPGVYVWNVLVKKRVYR